MTREKGKNKIILELFEQVMSFDRGGNDLIEEQIPLQVKVPSGT